MQPKQPTEVENQKPVCPACRGELVEIRAKLQCSRCRTICETCCGGRRSVTSGSRRGGVHGFTLVNFRLDRTRSYLIASRNARSARRREEMKLPMRNKFHGYYQPDDKWFAELWEKCLFDLYPMQLQTRLSEVTSASHALARRRNADRAAWR